MSLSPALVTRLLADGFRMPIPAGTTFTAGDIVPIGASLVCQAANDCNAVCSTSTLNSGNLVGLILCPKASTESLIAGQKVAWASTANGSTGYGNTLLGIATAMTTTTYATLYPLGIVAANSTYTSSTGGTQAYYTDNGTPAVEVLMWPGSGLGS